LAQYFGQQWADGDVKGSLPQNGRFLFLETARSSHVAGFGGVEGGEIVPLEGHRRQGPIEPAGAE
jgi:hypothetical protein